MITCCLLRIVHDQLEQALIIKPRWVTRPRSIFVIVGSVAKGSEPILCRALKDSVLAKRAVDEASCFSCWQSTFECIKHKAPNIGFRQVQGYSILFISLYAPSIHYIYIENINLEHS